VIESIITLIMQGLLLLIGLDVIGVIIAEIDKAING
jgi:hypothetical protein